MSTHRRTIESTPDCLIPIQRNRELSVAAPLDLAKQDSAIGSAQAQQTNPIKDDHTVLSVNPRRVLLPRIFRSKDETELERAGQFIQGD
jgi:hypothetical protein